MELVLLMQFLVHYPQPHLMELRVQVLEDIFQVVALVEVVFLLLQELMDLVVSEEVVVLQHKMELQILVVEQLDNTMAQEELVDQV